MTPVAPGKMGESVGRLIGFLAKPRPTNDLIVSRLATALFDVPIATVTLIDENRQWFKSCIGLSKKEDSRNAAFCAHVVYGREPVVIEDAFLDPRFADNPLVINEPRIRFYAGYPLILENGSCIGTLCLIDTRPRALCGPDLERLHDLANIVLQEIRNLSGHGKSGG